MFYKLDPSNYDIVQPILTDMLDIHLSIVSLLEALSPGAIFVDDLNEPESVFGYSMRRFFLAGSPNNEGFNQEVKGFFNDTLYPNAAEMNIPHFALHFSPLDWDDVIPKILECTYAIKEGRHYYNIRTSQLNQGWRSLIPQGFSLKMVDRSLLEQTHLQNLDALKDEMQSERASLEDFFQNSFGFCLVHEDEEIVAWCMSEYNCADRCEIGIETQEDYQRRGFATVTASAVIEHGFSTGLSEVGWHCYASNQASIATALKVGFNKTCEFTEYWALIDKAMQMAMKGNKCFQRADYAESVDWYKRSISGGDMPVWVYWNAACAYAYLKDQDKVIKYLGQAVEHGFSDVDLTQNSPHFTAFHDTSEWIDLIGELERG